MDPRHLVLLGLACGCFAPHPPEGAPCASTDHCPPPQQCVMGTCRLAEELDHDAAPPADVSLPDAPIDAGIDATILPCTTAGFTCGTGATTFMCGSTCFARCSATLTAATAESRCTAWSGRLGEILDATTNSCVQAHINDSTWIGLTQAATATTTAGDWTWNNTTPVVFTAWHAGKPDDADGNENHQEQCGHIETDGTWDDEACGNPRAFICQR